MHTCTRKGGATRFAGNGGQGIQRDVRFGVQVCTPYGKGLTMLRQAWTKPGAWAVAAIVCVGFAAAPASGQASKPAPGPTARPAPGPASKPAPFRDDWLGQIVQDELAQAVEKGACAPLEKKIQAAVLARLACGHLDAMQVLNELWHCQRACRYLPLAAQQADGAALVKALVGNKELARLLFRALDEVRSPKAALGVLQDLRRDAGAKTVEEYANLSVAFATSGPLRHYRPQPNPASASDSYKWYTDPKNRMLFDLKAMPYELSRYLADTRLSIDERRWAAKTYAAGFNPGRAYFDVAYDYEWYVQGKKKKIEDQPYTLANLRQYGGVCIDQAYFAAEVCKSLGVPAAVCTGEGASGIGHAWVGFLKANPQRKQAAWDCQTGRYESQRYYVGEVRDPASGKTILDLELMLEGAAALLPLQRREEAVAAVEMAELVDRLLDAPPEPDRAVLQALADAYNRKYAPDDAAKNRVDLDKAMPPLRKVDLSLAEDLLAAALERNLACKPAWELLIAMRRNNHVPVEHLDRFFTVLLDRTARDYPDYSCNMILRIAPTIPDVPARMKVYEKTLGVYGRRPDLQGRILIAVGDDFRDQKLSDKALAAYEKAATQSVEVAAVVLAAAERAERLLLEMNKRDAAIALYEKLWDLSRGTARSDAAVRSDTPFYKLGKRLAGLLRDAGRDPQAQNVTQTIER